MVVLDLSTLAALAGKPEPHTQTPAAHTLSSSFCPGDLVHALSQDYCFFFFFLKMQIGFELLVKRRVW